MPCSCPGRLALRLRGCSGAEVTLALVGCLPVAAPLSLSFPPSRPPRPLLSLLLSAFPTGLPSVSLEVVPKPACYSRSRSLLVVGVPEPGCERGLGPRLLRTQPPPSHPAAQSWAGAPRESEPRVGGLLREENLPPSGLPGPSGQEAPVPDPLPSRDRSQGCLARRTSLSDSGLSLLTVRRMFLGPSHRPGNGERAGWSRSYEPGGGLRHEQKAWWF